MVEPLIGSNRDEPAKARLLDDEEVEELQGKSEKESDDGQR